MSWWKQELPSEEEMQEGIENLAAHDNKVDFIVTHCCASSTQTLLGGGLYKTDILTEYHEKSARIQVLRNGSSDTITIIEM